MTIRLMVDCETLDTGERPVLLSIGAVAFNDTEVLGFFEMGINSEDCKNHGFTVSQSTLDWWDEQEAEAREVAFNGIYNLEIALTALCGFYKKYECKEVWSKGALADIRWINNALDHFGIEHPWEYYKEFCFRTLLKSVPKFVIPFEGRPHVAIDDAIHQAKQFIHIKKMQSNQIHI